MNNNFSLYLHRQQTVFVEFCFLKIGLRIKRMNNTFRSFLQKLPSKGFCHYIFGCFPISSNYQLQPVEQNFEREDNLTRYNQILKTFPPKFSSWKSSYFFKFNNLELSENFPRKFPYKLSPFPKDRKFWSKGKRPLLLHFFINRRLQKLENTNKSFYGYGLT